MKKVLIVVVIFFFIKKFWLLLLLFFTKPHFFVHIISYLTVLRFCQLLAYVLITFFNFHCII